MYKRPVYKKIIARLEEPRAFIQILSGPRQVGKTTLAHQVRELLPLPSHYASADAPTLRPLSWIEEQWEIGRLHAKQATTPLGALLILDEIQKIPKWSEIVKKLWDEDTAHGVNLKVVCLGSSTLLIQSGLAESLTGRFEIFPIAHWSFGECKAAFGLTVDEYIYFGGYPGAALLIKDQARWATYITDSIIETSLSRDIMLMVRVHKPALLRRLFELGCHHSGTVFSYQQMLGQLQDAGNAHTLAQYLELLAKAGFISGLQKFSLPHIRQKASSPKLQVLNTALISALHHLTFEEAKNTPHVWNTLVESAIGAHLLNSSFGTQVKIYYWKEGSKEVDFILRKGHSLLAIEIKDVKKTLVTPGIEAFCQNIQSTKKLIVGKGGLSVEELLSSPLEALF